jgi:hypothetical protein
MHIQQRAQDRQDFVRMSVELGMAEHKQDSEAARAVLADPNVEVARVHVAPLLSYVIVAMRTLNTLTAKGDVTPDDIRNSNAETEALLAAFPGYPGARDDGDNA